MRGNSAGTLRSAVGTVEALVGLTPISGLSLIVARAYYTPGISEECRQLLAVVNQLSFTSPDGALSIREPTMEFNAAMGRVAFKQVDVPWSEVWRKVVAAIANVAKEVCTIEAEDGSKLVWSEFAMKLAIAMRDNGHDYQYSHRDVKAVASGLARFARCLANEAALLDSIREANDPAASSRVLQASLPGYPTGSFRPREERTSRYHSGPPSEGGEVFYTRVANPSCTGPPHEFPDTKVVCYKCFQYRDCWHCTHCKLPSVKGSGVCSRRRDGCPGKEEGSSPPTTAQIKRVIDVVRAEAATPPRTLAHPPQLPRSVAAAAAPPGYRGGGGRYEAYHPHLAPRQQQPSLAQQHLALGGSGGWEVNAAQPYSCGEHGHAPPPPHIYSAGAGGGGDPRWQGPSKSW